MKYNTIVFEFNEMRKLDELLSNLGVEVISVNITERGRDKRIGETRFKAFIVTKTGCLND